MNDQTIIVDGKIFWIKTHLLIRIDQEGGIDIMKILIYDEETLEIIGFKPQTFNYLYNEEI